MLSKIMNLFTNEESTTVTTKEIKMDDLNFNDRITYLAWRKEWFKAFNEAKAAVRAGKQAFKEEQRKVTVVAGQYGNASMYEGKYLSYVSAPNYYKWFSEHGKLVAEVEKLVNLRMQSRWKSAKQREESLKAKGL